MSQLRKRTIGKTLGTAVCLAVLLFAPSGCKNSTTPDGNQKARIRVNNGCGIDVDIYMDGAFQSFLLNREYFYIDNVTLGTHLLEAKKRNTGTLLKSATANITENQDYTWTVSSAAVITVTNNYGETISLYADGNYYDDLDDQVVASLTNVEYGTHHLEAKRPNQTEVLTETTLDIFEDKTYTWTITKPN